MKPSLTSRIGMGCAVALVASQVKAVRRNERSAVSRPDILKHIKCLRHEPATKDPELARALRLLEVWLSTAQSTAYHM